MKVLIISPTYMVRINQRKLEILAETYGAEMQCVTPEEWIEANRFHLKPELPDKNLFKLNPIATWGGSQSGRVLFKTVDLGLRDFRPDIIQVEISARCLALTQVLIFRRLWAPRAKVVFFTWVNLEFPLKPLFLHIFENFNLYRSDAAIVGNEDAKNILIKNNFRGPIQKIPQLGVDTEWFKPGSGDMIRGRYQIDPAAFVIGFASRMVPEKGVTFLIRAAAQLSGNWLLFLIGRGPDRMNADECVKRFGIEDRVRFVDEVAHLEIVNYMRAMDVFVLPSYETEKWKEQFAGGPLQAMATGIPTISAMTGEVPEVVGDAGLLFQEKNVKELKNALVKIQTNDEFRKDLIQKGFERVRSEYSWGRIAEKTDHFWRELLSER